ncbi:MAG: catalase family peroxidase [Actinobacteria bacterium]|nr:catalase family peroxidase [Actinomycetota bacterium]
MDIAQELLEAIHAVYGLHPEHRSLHAKGSCLTGTFTATPTAGRLTRAAHMAGEPVPVTVRFSNGTGTPHVHDGAMDGRGLAIKFHLPDGTTTDFVGLTLPVFFVRTPEDLLEFTRARTDPEAVGPFLAAHPETVPAVTMQLSALPRASYAQTTFFGIHAFKFVAADGTETWIRYRWQPDAGEETLAQDEADGLAADYLQDEVRTRVERAPITFTLFLQLADDGDPTDDPTAQWPDEREQVEAGRLELTAVAEDCERLVFDPMRLTDGIEPSDDKILRARPAAYSVSIEKRFKS